MSTVLAIVLSVLIAIAFPLASAPLAPVLDGLFEASDTGGPILYGLLLAGFVGYGSYASLYVALRVFKRASASGVFWVFVVLSFLGQATSAWQRYQWGGEGLLGIVGSCIVGILAMYFGAGLGRGFAVVDTGRQEPQGAI